MYSFQNLKTYECGVFKIIHYNFLTLLLNFISLLLDDLKLIVTVLGFSYSDPKGKLWVPDWGWMIKRNTWKYQIWQGKRDFFGFWVMWWRSIRPTGRIMLFVRKRRNILVKCEINKQNYGKSLKVAIFFNQNNIYYW